MVIEQTREVLQAYPIKAYYLDAVGGGTHNGAVMGPDQYLRFRETFGFEFPGLEELTPTQRAAYIRWVIKETGAFVDRVRRVAADLRPEVAFTYNYSGRPDVCDFVTSDFFVFGTGALGVLTGLRRNAALSRSAMGEALLDTVGQNWGAGVKGEDGYLAETWSARALNVAVCSSFVLPLNGRISSAEMNLAERALREQAACEEWFADIDPIFQVGILNAHDARKFRPVDPEYPDLHQRAYEGWAQAAIAGHFLWDYLDEWLLTPERLARLPVVVLPAASCLAAASVEVLRQYVHTGGTLIATGDTSCFSADGTPAGEFQLADVFGARLRGEREADAVFLERGAEGDPLYLPSGQWPVAADTEVRVAGAVRRYAKLRPNEGTRPLHGMTLGSRQPGWIEQAYGKGRCCYLAGMPGLEYALRGRHASKRFMIARLRDALAGRNLLTVEAPDTVETFAHWQPTPRRLVVNLVNQVAGCSRSMTGARIEDVDCVPPVVGTRIQFHAQYTGAIEKAYLAPDRLPVPLEDSPTGKIARLPSFRVHATLVAEP